MSAEAVGRLVGLVILAVLTASVLANGIAMSSGANFILGRLGLLQAAESLGRLTFGLGALTMLAALALL